MQTYDCPYCRCHFSEADKSWDFAIESGQCPECREPFRKSAVTKQQEQKPRAQQPKRQEEEIPATQQSHQGSSVSTQHTRSVSPLAAAGWKQIGAEEAKNHPLYGVRGWLLVLASVLVFGFLVEVSRINAVALSIGMSLNKLLTLDIPIIRIQKVSLIVEGLAVIIIYLLLFSKHPGFRPVSSCILLGIWPALVIAGILNPSPEVIDALAMSFFPYAVNCAVWVTYLQRSKRVRVTFEHSVKPDASERAMTVAPVCDRQFNEDSPETHVLETPLGASKAKSFFQPTANPIAPVPIPEPSQSTTELHEDRLYEQIAQELEANTVDKGLWTKAYAQAGGDDKQTRVLYIKARFARLLAIENARNVR